MKALSFRAGTLVVCLVALPDDSKVRKAEAATGQGALRVAAYYTSTANQ